ncbi:MAG: AAA family ATPase, partial [Solirubrobacteraceae bacterium]
MSTEADARRLLELRWAQDAIADPPSPRPTLVEGFLRRGELSVLGAARGVGKSWFAENLAVLGARGEGFLGGTLRVARPFKTLIAQGELDEYESAIRWAMLTGTGAVPIDVAESFSRWRLKTVRRRSSTSGGSDVESWNQSDEWLEAILDDRVEATIAEHGFDLFVIDPWAVFFAGNENSNDEVESALDKLRVLSLRYGLAILILHHFGKAGDAREPEDLWRGASRLADWASTRVTFVPHFTDSAAKAQGMTRQQARRFVDVKF